MADEEVDVLGHEDANEIDHEDAEAEKEPVKARDLFFRIWTRREALVKALGGTVYDSDIPAVSGDNLIVSDKNYSISDIRIPEMSGIYASVCIYNNGITSELSFVRL